MINLMAITYRQVKMDKDILLQFIRNAAWERAQCELQIIRSAYYGEYGECDKVEEFDRLLRNFIRELEENGIVE
jgi:hypothetical protein